MGAGMPPVRPFRASGQGRRPGGVLNTTRSTVSRGRRAWGGSGEAAVRQAQVRAGQIRRGIAHDPAQGQCAWPAAVV